ncbi:MAG: Rieske (2Fe-2S) protein [Nitrospirota bacterium]
MSNETNNKEGVSRRNFLSLASWGAAILASIPVVGGSLRMMKPTVHYEESTKFKIGTTENFPIGTIRKLDDQKVFILSDDEGLYAISAVCTHLGCIVFKTELGFQCPCHGSRYNERGKVIAGPAPRALPWFEITQDVNGTIIVDASKEVPQGTKYKFV